MSQRLQELQARNIKNLAISGVALIVVWPVAWLLVPFGFFIGAALAVVGVVTLVRSFVFKARLERQRLGSEARSG